MRRITIITATLVLTACSSNPGEAPDQGEAEASASTTANGSVAGVYEVASGDGLVSIVTLNEDGTYSQVTPEGTDAAEGTFEIVDGKTCFKVHTIGAEPLCYTESERAEDGSYTATPDGGDTLTVRPMPAAEVTG